MVFSSTIFLFMFLPITLLVYFTIEKKFRNIWLLLVSLVFFAWSQPKYIWVILVSVVINYISGILVSLKNRNIKDTFLSLSIITNLGLLFYFKYLDFTITTINNIFKLNIFLRNITLPIGISFFTFQGMSYVIDVYNQKVKAQKNPLKVALYITLFPQLIAGPIVRYTTIAKEIDNRKTTLDDFTYGIQRFVIGLAKKVLIANTMGYVVDNIWEAGVAQNTVLIAWFGAIAYMIQIFFDFSGYSDMAIGLGRIFGFHFDENFNLPYISKSISEFWRRWHISLGTWFRDYVYIPLGGNRKNVYLNLLIVFLLTGIWHGAAWHYIVWGVINGVFILIERFLKNRNFKSKLPRTLTSILQHIYAIFVILIGWVLFRSPSLKLAIKYLLTMIGIGTADKPGFNLSWYANKWTVFILIVGIIFSTNLPTILKNKCKEKFNEKVYLILKYIMIIALLYFSIFRIVSGTYNPFIYFQF